MPVLVLRSLTRVASRNSGGGAIVKQVDYEYDAFNRLVRRAFDADGTGAGVATNQYWVYDEGINAVLQFDGSAASNLSHRYLWSDNVDELLADEVVTSPSSGVSVHWPILEFSDLARIRRLGFCVRSMIPLVRKDPHDVAANAIYQNPNLETTLR